MCAIAAPTVLEAADVVAYLAQDGPVQVPTIRGAAEGAIAGEADEGAWRQVRIRQVERNARVGQVKPEKVAHYPLRPAKYTLSLPLPLLRA